MNNQYNRDLLDDILNIKILIKDFLAVLLSIGILVSIALLYFFDIKLETALLLSFEQSIFIILSAILVVFHESIVGYRTLSKIANMINNFKKDSARQAVFSSIDLGSSDKYDEFVESSKNRISKFKVNIMIFKRNSFFIYILFTILGIIVIAFSLINIESSWIVKGNIILDKSIVIEFLVFFQIYLIPIWIISAFQSERQKSKVLQYFDVSTFSKQIKLYLKDAEEKSLTESLEKFVGRI